LPARRISQNFIFIAFLNLSQVQALNDFIIQARIERSLFFLVNHPVKSIHDIALECGFSNTSSFSRCFKEIKGISSSQWRLAYKNSKICKDDSKIGTWPVTVENYFAHKLNQHEMMNMSKEPIDIKVLELPELNVAYITALLLKNVYAFV
jgi:AraC family transcriptional regulator